MYTRTHVHGHGRARARVRKHTSTHGHLFILSEQPRFCHAYSELHARSTRHVREEHASHKHGHSHMHEAFERKRGFGATNGRWPKPRALQRAAIVAARRPRQ